MTSLLVQCLRFLTSNAGDLVRELRFPTPHGIAKKKKKTQEKKNMCVCVGVWWWWASLVAQTVKNPPAVWET